MTIDSNHPVTEFDAEINDVQNGKSSCDDP